MNDRIYPPQTTALVLIDVLNDFLADDGKLHASIAPMLDKTGFVAHVAQLLDGARAAGVKIIFAPHGTDEHSFDDIKHVHPRMQWALQNEVLRKGSYGADFYAPLRPRDAPAPPPQASDLVPECNVQAGDVIVTKRQWGAFYGTDLEQQLRRRGIRTIALTGIATNFGVESTARTAFDQGYELIFIEDAMSGLSEQTHRFPVEHIFPRMGFVRSTEEFVSAVAENGTFGGA